MKHLRIIKKTFIAFLLLFIACILAALALFQNPRIKSAFLNRASKELHLATGWKINCESVEGLLPLQFKGSNLTVMTPSHDLITVENFHIIISPWDLLSGHLILHIGEIKNFSIPKGLWDNNLLSINASGIIEFHPARGGLTALLELKNSQLEGNSTLLTLSLLRQKQFLITHAVITEPSSGGVISSSLNMPLLNSSIITLNATGSSSEWNGSFSNRTTFTPSQYILSASGDFAFSKKKGLEVTAIEGCLSTTQTQNASLVSLDGKMEILPDGTIAQGSLNFSSASLSSIGEALAIPLTGSIGIHCGLSESLFSPHLTIDLVHSDCFLNENPLENLTLKIDGEILPQGLSGHVITSMQTKNLPLDLSTDISWNWKEKLDISDIYFHLQNMTLSGALAVDLEHYLTQGNISLTSHDLAEVSTLLEIDLKGSLEVKSTFYSSQGEQLIDVKAKGSDIYLASLFAPELFFSTAINLSQLAWPYNLSIEGKSENIQLQSKGNWTASEDFLLQISLLEGVAANHSFSLKQPTKLQLRQGTIELSPLDFVIGQGTFFTTFDYTPEHVTIYGRGSDIPLDLLTLVHPGVSFKGSFNGEIKLNGIPNELLGEIQADIQNATFDSQISLAKIPPLNGSFQAKIIPQQLEASGTLYGIGSLPMDFSAHIPLEISFTPALIKIDLEKQFDLHMNLSGEIAPLLQMVMTHTTSVTGQASTELNINGTLAKPKISGKIILENGSYESLLSGAMFKDIKATIEGDGEELRLISLSAIDSDQGSISGSGSIALNPSRLFPFDIEMELKQATLLHLDYARATASGKIQFQGNLEKQNLSGIVAIDKATIQIPEEVPAKMRALQVTYINHPPDIPLPSYIEQKNRTKNPIHLNLQLNVPKRAFVQGKNFTSEWQGAITITGTDENPLLNGGLEVIKGEYFLNGKKFKVTHGVIDFSGDPANKTSLYVSAGQEIEDIKVEVVLKGSIKQPKITFRSNPPMSQKEILSWILFNRGTSSITASENAELRKSIVTLSGGDAGTDILGKIRRSFGIDRIDISSKDSKDTNEVSLRVGKYISRGLFLSVNKSINGEANQVSIEANISRYIKAQAEVGDNAEGKMILKWQKDY